MAQIISIISPSYQQAKYLGEAISSVITQVGDFYIDYQVMDGGSTDGSVEVIKQLEQNLQSSASTQEIDGLKYYIPESDSMIKCLGVSFRWVSRQDKGQAAAISEALDNAKGQIFSYLNSDDVYEAGAIATIIDSFAQNPEADVIYGNAFYINSQGKITGMYPPMDINAQSIDETCVISQPSAFIRMKAIEQYGKFNPRIKNSLDYEYWLRLWHAGAKFKYIRPVLSSTRIHSETKTQTNRWRINMESLAAVSHHNGSVPAISKANFASESSIVGNIFSLAVRVMRLLQKVAMRIYGPIFFSAQNQQISKTEKTIFSSPN